jgi:septal ring factor EnvC (AmiA/AmiB activator)
LRIKRNYRHSKNPVFYGYRNSKRCSQRLTSTVSAKKEQEAKEASLQKQYTNNLAKIRAETEARRKELEALEARKATAAAQAAGVKSPATGAMTAAWFKENAVLISLGIALIGLALRVKGK